MITKSIIKAFGWITREPVRSKRFPHFQRYVPSVRSSIFPTVWWLTPPLSMIKQPPKQKLVIWSLNLKYVQCSNLTSSWLNHQVPRVKLLNNQGAMSQGLIHRGSLLQQLLQLALTLQGACGSGWWWMGHWVCGSWGYWCWVFSRPFSL